MRKASILAGIGVLGLTVGLASPAFADDTPGQPVHATVQVETTISISGVSPTVAFGQVIPGNTVTETGAENPEVITNDSHGAAILVTNQNGGFHVAVGNPDIIPDSAVSVKTSGVGQPGNVSLSETGPVQVANAATGDHTYPEDWSITVPASTPAGDPLFADFSIGANAE